MGRSPVFDPWRLIFFTIFILTKEVRALKIYQLIVMLITLWFENLNNIAYIHLYIDICCFLFSPERNGDGVWVCGQCFVFEQQRQQQRHQRSQQQCCCREDEQRPGQGIRLQGNGVRRMRWECAWTYGFTRWELYVAFQMFKVLRLCETSARSAFVLSARQVAVLQARLCHVSANICVKFTSQGASLPLFSLALGECRKW